MSKEVQPVNSPTLPPILSIANIGKSILAVDDNLVNLKLVQYILDENDLKFRMANSGEMALKSVKSNKPDLILLDITMPGMDGYSVCKALKSDPDTRNIPVIFLSALNESIDSLKGFSVGGIDFITKPFEPEVLVARVNSHLTISHLQNELLELNSDLEKRVEQRTEVISKTNASLTKEVDRRIAVETQLRKSEEFHRLTLENLGETLVITTDANGGFNYISPNIETILEYSIDEANDLGSINILFPGHEQRFASDISNVEIETLSKSGKVHTLNVSIKSTNILAPMRIYSCQDITSKKQLEEARKKDAERLKHALNVSNEGIWDWNIISNEIVYNEAFFTMLGYKYDDLPTNQEAWFELVNAEDIGKCQELINHCTSGESDHFQIKYRLRMHSGEYLWILAKGEIVERGDHGQPIRFVGTHTDIQFLTESEALLRYQATYDSLTQLPNRTLFLQLLKNTIAHAVRSARRHAVLFIDLDKFKIVNDSLGHSAGDKLLQEVAVRISKALREEDTVARLGGDEFVVLLEDIPSPEKVAEISNRIIDSLNVPFMLQGHSVVVTPSIGIVLYPEHGDTHEKLLSNADTAMYCSKRRGGSCFEFFSNDMNVAVNARLESEAELRDGLENGEFIQYYQPQMNLKTGEICGMESLTRWDRNNCIIAPNNFLPLAEETGLIIPLGEAILKNSLLEAKSWVDRNLFSHRISINISATQLRQKNLMQMIDTAIEQTGLPAEHIELEITEAAVIDNFEMALHNMQEIRNRGVTLSLDDFGTGYSSLSYLTKFPIDTLKIDISLIKEIEHSEKDRNIVKSTIDLAHSLNLRVVAEGVETEAQVKILSELNCDAIQGFYYAKPIDKHSVTKLVNNPPSIPNI